MARLDVKGTYTITQLGEARRQLTLATKRVASGESALVELLEEKLTERDAAGALVFRGRGGGPQCGGPDWARLGKDKSIAVYVKHCASAKAMVQYLSRHCKSYPDLAAHVDVFTASWEALQSEMYFAIAGLVDQLSLGKGVMRRQDWEAAVAEVAKVPGHCLAGLSAPQLQRRWSRPAGFSSDTSSGTGTFALILAAELTPAPPERRLLIKIAPEATDACGGTIWYDHTDGVLFNSGEVAAQDVSVRVGERIQARPSSPSGPPPAAYVLVRRAADKPTQGAKRARGADVPQQDTERPSSSGDGATGKRPARKTAVKARAVIPAVCQEEAGGSEAAPSSQTKPPQEPTGGSTASPDAMDMEVAETAPDGLPSAEPAEGADAEVVNVQLDQADSAAAADIDMEVAEDAPAEDAQAGLPSAEPPEGAGVDWQPRPNRGNVLAAAVMGRAYEEMRRGQHTQARQSIQLALTHDAWHPDARRLARASQGHLVLVRESKCEGAPSRIGIPMDGSPVAVGRGVRIEGVPWNWTSTISRSHAELRVGAYWDVEIADGGFHAEDRCSLHGITVNGVRVPGRPRRPADGPKPAPIVVPEGAVVEFGGLGHCVYRLMRVE